MSEKPNYYAILPAAVRYDKSISPAAKLIYAEITALSNTNGYCTAKNKYFAELYDKTDRQIRNIIAELKTNGYIIINTEKNTRKIFCIDAEKNFREGGKKFPQREEKNFHHNNTSINNIFNNNSSEQNSEPHVITLTLNDKSEYPVTDKYLREMEELYPNVDVMGELRKMRAWLLNNYQRRKTRQGITRFINSWLCREQDKAKVKQADDTPPYYEEFIFDDDE